MDLIFTCQLCISGCLSLSFLSKNWVDGSRPAHQTRPLFLSARTQELEEAHRDAASNVLVAICRHVWRLVAQHLETEVLSGVFPPRSLLYVMGVLTSNGTSRAQGLGLATLCPQASRGRGMS